MDMFIFLFRDAKMIEEIPSLAFEANGSKTKDKKKGKRAEGDHKIT